MVAIALGYRGVRSRVDDDVVVEHVRCSDIDLRSSRVVHPGVGCSYVTSPIGTRQGAETVDAHLPEGTLPRGRARSLIVPPTGENEAERGEDPETHRPRV